jgi:hypothetical protein
MKKPNRTTGASPTADPQHSAVLECRFCGAEYLPELEEMPCQNCNADTPFRFITPGTPRNYREILNSVKLKDRDIAAAFGYKDLGAFTSSTAAPRVKAGVEFVFYAALFNRW